MFGNRRNPGWFEVYLKIETNTKNLDVGTLLKQRANWDKTKDKLRVTIEISNNVVVYSDDPTKPALTILKNDFRDYDRITILIKNGAKILGAGGAAGIGGSSKDSAASNGGRGGTALYAQRSVVVFNHGEVYGGGGGGGGGGGHTATTGGTYTWVQNPCRTFDCLTYSTEQQCTETKKVKGSCAKKDKKGKCKKWNEEERCTKHKTKYKYNTVRKCYVPGIACENWGNKINCYTKGKDDKPNNTSHQVADCFSKEYSGGTSTNYRGGNGGNGSGFNTPFSSGQTAANSSYGGKGGSGGNWGESGSDGTDGSTLTKKGLGGLPGSYATDHVIFRGESTGRTAGSKTIIRTLIPSLPR